MIYRKMYRSEMKLETCVSFRSQLAEHEQLLRRKLHIPEVLTCSIFAYQRTLCIYMETTDPGFEFSWPELLVEGVECWPGEGTPRTVVKMMDVFHDGVPADEHSWREGRSIEGRSASLARLNEAWVSSYIFYHYQMQEEYPESFNKTYLIGLHEQLIFSYHETPTVVTRPRPRGLLSTEQTPKDWHAVMLPHFQPWEGVQEAHRLWVPMEEWFTTG